MNKKLRLFKKTSNASENWCVVLKLNTVTKYCFLWYSFAFTVPGGGEPFPYVAQKMPLPAKGFGTNLAMFGDLILHRASEEEIRPLIDFLIKLFSCMSDQPNAANFSILGK